MRKFGPVFLTLAALAAAWTVAATLIVGRAREAVSEVSTMVNDSREVVLSLYRNLNEGPQGVSLAEHGVRVVEAHFAESFVGHGGPENHDYDLEGFKRILRSQFGKFPAVRNTVEEVMSEGAKTLVRIRLSDGQTEVNYLALYLVRDGMIVERWAYGDGNFR